MNGTLRPHSHARPGVRAPRPWRAARATLLVAAMLLAGGSLRAQHALVSLPMEDPAHAMLGALERQGCVAARVSPFRPYLVGRVREAVQAARGEARCAGPLLDALAARFPRDTTGAHLDSVPRPDTLAGVAPDLAAAVTSTHVETPRASQSNLGGALTLRLTGLGKGDFRPLWNGPTPVSEGTPPAVAILRVRGTIDGGEHLVGVIEAYGETNRRNDPLVRARRLRTTSGVVDFSDAYVNGQLGRLLLSFGRAPEAWLGEENESLVLSAHGPPLDRLMASAVWRRVEARAVVGSLDDVLLTRDRDSLDVPDAGVRLSRFVIAHALTIRPSPVFEVTVGENAVLSRSSRMLEFSYLNPLMIYQVTQNDSGRLARSRDNLAIFGGVRLRTGAATLSGELFVDELQLDAGDRKVNPDQLAWRLQGTMPLALLWPASIGAEYRRIDNYTYLRGVYSEAFQHYGRPLGSELGPGADLLDGSAELWPTALVRLRAHAGVWRQGALRIGDRPGPSPLGNAGAPFPRTLPDRPGVQRGLLAGLEGRYLGLRTPITARLELARIENANNLTAPAALYVRAQLMGTYAFRYP